MMITTGLTNRAASSFAVFLALLALEGCSRGAGDQPDGAWAAEAAWTVAETPSFQLAGKVLDEVPADPVNVISFNKQYLVPDGAANGSHRVLVYDASGRYLSAWGRKGPGPGEFAHLSGWSGVFGGDSIAVQDFGGKELEVFGPSGTPARAIRVPLPGSVLGLLPNAHLLLASPRIPNVKDSMAVGIFGPDSKLVRIVHVFPLPPATRGFDDPYVGPRPTLAAGKDRIYYTNGIDFAVDVYDTLGHHVRTLRRPLERLPMTTNDKEEIIQQLVGEYRERPGGEQAATDFEKILRTGGRWSEYMIAWGSIIEDSDGNVWLEHYRSIYPHIERRDGRKTIWSVFDPGGRFLGEVAIPPRVTVATISHDAVLGFWKDDLDVRHVAAYALSKPESRK